MLAEIIATARKRLAENPFDALHGVEHHQNVWNNCEWIIEKEGLSPDLDVLQIAVWWHDVERDSEEFPQMKRTLRDAGASDEFIGKVLAAVSTHSFGHTQDILEGKILYDADKLEYLSINRVKELLRIRKQGQMGEARFEYYQKTWAKRLKQVPKSLHFESSKTRFQEDLRKFLEFAQTQPTLESMISSML